MNKPAKPALTERKVHGGKTSMSQHFLVGDLLLPCNSKELQRIVGGRYSPAR